MIKSVNVICKNPEHNYSTSVNFWASKKSLEEYFVGSSFFVGTCDSQEKNPDYWAKVERIEINQPLAIVKKGSFKGLKGRISPGLNKNMFHLATEKGSCLVVKGQFELVK